jgi:hypothetical protein
MKIDTVKKKIAPHILSGNYCTDIGFGRYPAKTSFIIGATTFSITTLSIMTFSITTLSIMT